MTPPLSSSQWYDRSCVSIDRAAPPSSCDLSDNLENINQLVQEQPENPLFWQSKGAIHKQLDQIDEAVAAFTKAAELFCKQDKLAEALLIYEDTLTIRNNDVNILIQCVRILIVTNQHTETVLNLEKIAKLQSHNTEAQKLREMFSCQDPLQLIMAKADIFCNLGDKEGAIQFLLNSAILLSRQGPTDSSSEQYNSPLECYEKVLTIDPNQLDALFQCSISYLLQTKITKAQEMIDRITAINPQHEYVAQLKALLNPTSTWQIFTKGV